MDGILLDEKDIQILDIIQENCRLSLKDLSKRTGLPITTVHTRLKKLEKQGVIKGCHAVLDSKVLGFSVTAFILVSFTYKAGREKLSQRDIARKIAGFPEVQEVHIVTGEWDIIVKVKVRSVDELGRFVVDKLRTIEGVDKTLTSVVLDTAKETLSIPVYKVKF